MPGHHPRRLHPRVRPAATPDISAVDDLRFIRQTMERSAPFTAVSGWGMVAVGASALPAAWLASHSAFDLRWIEIWICEAALAVALSIVAIQSKAARVGLPWTSGPARKVALSFLPPVAAAALLTFPLLRANLGSVLPGLWMLLYGVALVSAGTFSVSVLRIVGVCFMITGAAALFLPNLANLAMATGFGALHILFGVWIARRHGG
jgi:hypothetical protein